MAKKSRPESPVTKKNESVSFGKFVGLDLSKSQYKIMTWILGIGILITLIWMAISVINFLGEVVVYLLFASVGSNPSFYLSLNAFQPMIASLILFWILIISRLLLKKVKFV